MSAVDLHCSIPGCMMVTTRQGFIDQGADGWHTVTIEVSDPRLRPAMTFFLCTRHGERLVEKVIQFIKSEGIP